MTGLSKLIADVIPFHEDATYQPAKLLEAIRKTVLAAGLVLNPDTAVSSIEPLLREVDVIVIKMKIPEFGGIHKEDAIQKSRRCMLCARHTLCTCLTLKWKVRFPQRMQDNSG